MRQILFSIAFASTICYGKGNDHAVSPAEQLKTFTLKEGFTIELVASEEHGIINPIDLTFDDAGRLWTQTARMYPLDPVTGINFRTAVSMMTDPNLADKYPEVSRILSLYKLENRGSDQILIMEDPTKTATSPLHVWADGLTIPQSIYPYKDGCYVAHGSEFYFLNDANQDGVQDEVHTEMSGFGIFDTHTMAHSIVRGPGGWLNFSHGALNSGTVTLTENGKQVPITYAKNLRYSINGEHLEVLNVARDNVWGYQVKSNGQWYATSANDLGVSVLPMEDQTGISGIGGEKIRDYQPLINSVHSFRVGGTGISGLAFSEDGEYGFPQEWANDVAFLANPITRTINAVKIDRLPSGEIVAEHLDDLLQCSDEWFRPVNIEFGPDGCLYIADWYNKVVSHNEISTDHPDRDRSHGRIWRVRHESQRPFAVPNVAVASPKKLIKHLTEGHTLWEKRAAWKQIVDQNQTSLIPELKSILRGHYDKDVMILALWCLEELSELDATLMTQTLAHHDGDIRREAIRSLASYSPSAETVAHLLTPYIHDDNAMVRSQVLRTLAEVNVANQNTISLLVSACHAPVDSLTFGAGYEENFERFLARKALELYPAELYQYLQSDRADESPKVNQLWAMQALPKEQLVQIFAQNWESIMHSEIDPHTFITLSELLSEPSIASIAKAAFDQRPKEMLDIAYQCVSSINTFNVCRFLRPHISQLLRSDNPSKIRLGLQHISTLHSPYHIPELTDLLTTSPQLRSETIKALGQSRQVTAEVYQNLLKADDLTFSQTLSAVAALTIATPDKAYAHLQQWVPSLSESQRAIVARRLSYSKHGAGLVIKLISHGSLQAELVDYDSAYRIAHFLHNAPSRDLLAKATQKESAEKAARTAKVEHYYQASKQLNGNPEMGKALFSACLACHAVGDQGVAVGPPLDGSASRNPEHLLTAIVQPDDAVESAYALYSITLFDGSVELGMIKNKTNKGTTLIGASGITTFIPRHLIHTEGNVNSRSLMPRSFGSFPDQTMVDLLSYIRTLE